MSDMPAEHQDGTEDQPGAPRKQHGDPLLSASKGETEGTDGSRHGADADAAAREQRPESSD